MRRQLGSPHVRVLTGVFGTARELGSFEIEEFGERGRLVELLVVHHLRRAKVAHSISIHFAKRDRARKKNSLLMDCDIATNARDFAAQSDAKKFVQAALNTLMCSRIDHFVIHLVAVVSQSPKVNPFH